MVAQRLIDSDLSKAITVVGFEVQPKKRAGYVLMAQKRFGSEPPDDVSNRTKHVMMNMNEVVLTDVFFLKIIEI